MALNVIRKKEGKQVEAWQLGQDSGREAELMASGAISKGQDEKGQDCYYLHSQEAQEGQGQRAYEGDYFKVDGDGFPYPIKQETFEAKHTHIQGDTYEQTPENLYAMNMADMQDPENAKVMDFLKQNYGLQFDPQTGDVSAQLWGTTEHAHMDPDPDGFSVTGAEGAEGAGHVMVFYNFEVDDQGYPTDAMKDGAINFVAPGSAQSLYEVVETGVPTPGAEHTAEQSVKETVSQHLLGFEGRDWTLEKEESMPGFETFMTDRIAVTAPEGALSVSRGVIDHLEIQADTQYTAKLDDGPMREVDGLSLARTLDQLNHERLLSPDHDTRTSGYDAADFGRSFSADGSFTLTRPSGRPDPDVGYAGTSEGRVHMQLMGSMAAQPSVGRTYCFEVPDAESATGLSRVECPPGTCGTHDIGLRDDNRGMRAVTLGADDTYTVVRPSKDGFLDVSEMKGSEIGQMYEKAKESAVQAANQVSPDRKLEWQGPSFPEFDAAAFGRSFADGYGAPSGISRFNAGNPGVSEGYAGMRGSRTVSEEARKELDAIIGSGTSFAESRYAKKTPEQLGASYGRELDRTAILESGEARIERDAGKGMETLVTARMQATAKEGTFKIENSAIMQIVTIDKDATALVQIDGQNKGIMDSRTLADTLDAQSIEKQHGSPEDLFAKAEMETGSRTYVSTDLKGEVTGVSAEASEDKISIRVSGAQLGRTDDGRTSVTLPDQGSPTGYRSFAVDGADVSPAGRTRSGRETFNVSLDPDASYFVTPLNISAGPTFTGLRTKIPETSFTEMTGREIKDMNDAAIQQRREAVISREAGRGEPKAAGSRRLPDVSGISTGSDGKDIQAGE